MISILVLCYPTYSGLLHLDSKGSSVVLAPDEMLLLFTRMGHRVEAVNLSPFPTSLCLMRSGLTMSALDDVEPDRFDVCWHMFRDPAQPEVIQLSGSFTGWFPRERVVNHVNDLALFYKRNYLPVLERLGIGPRVCDVDPGSIEWLPTDHCAAVSVCRRFVRTSDYNNNRGDYPEREARGDVVTEFLDGAKDGRRSFFRVGYAAAKVLPGWLYSTTEDRMILKSGMCRQKEQHSLPDDQHPEIVEAMKRMGIDAAHLEGTYLDGKAHIFDVNPYPTSYGKTLSTISEAMCQALEGHWKML